MKQTREKSSLAVKRLPQLNFLTSNFLKLVFRSFLFSLFLPLPILESGAFFYPKVFIKVS